TYYNLPRVKCPGCGAAVKDGTSICPKCDFIIDGSFLEGAPAPAARAPTPTPSKPKLRPAGAGAVARAPTGESKVRRGPPGEDENTGKRRAPPPSRSGGAAKRPSSMPEAPARESDESRAERARSRASDDWRPKNQPIGVVVPKP